MHPLKDMTGQIIGDWKVLNLCINKPTLKSTGAYWNCECLKCKKIKVIYGAHLRNGQSSTCNCKSVLNLIGNIYNNWEVIDKKTVGIKKQKVWICQCKTCKTIRHVENHIIKNINLINCYCTKVKKIIGQKFNKLTILEAAPSKTPRCYVLCKCECGNEKIIGLNEVLNGQTKSCDCLKRVEERKKIKDGAGYLKIYKPSHPNANKRGYVREHTYVMSESIKRPLKRGETVHHRNGIRDDNRLENLELWTYFHPPGQRVEDMVTFCKWYLDEYEQIVTK